MFFSTGMIRENGSVGKAIVLLEKGGVVGVFPEGTRSPDGKLGEGRKGVAVMALMAGVPVIPCGITGAFEAYPRDAAFPRPFPVKVSIGKAVIAAKDKDPGDARIDALLDMIMSAIKDEMGE